MLFSIEIVSEIESRTVFDDEFASLSDVKAFITQKVKSFLDGSLDKMILSVTISLGLIESSDIDLWQTIVNHVSCE